MNKALLFTIILAFATSALAGGSWDEVKIQSLTINGTSYELVVVPQSPKSQVPDPFMGGCTRFTVRGTYAWPLTWRFPDDVNRENHKAALVYLQQAFTDKRPVLLGWMGTGFVPINASDPCVVRSRALQLWKDEKATAVISYHNAV